jgi:outer membrane protein assembly factor BamB
MIRCLSCILVLACAQAARADNWPAWRGPHGDGHSPESNLPVKWDATHNVRWKVPLPDQGNSSPIVWGDRIFVTQASDKTIWPPRPASGGYAAAAKRSVLCFERATGKLLWQQDTAYPEKEWTHSTNPFCSASPVTDGERVIASHGSAGMVCYDLNGKELWRHDLGKLEHIWGNASSPVLYENLVILWCGPGERQFLLAIDKVTGKTVWKVDIPGGNDGKDGKWVGSWCTPIVARVQDHDELILGVPREVKAFDPKTGKERWSCGGLGDLVYASPVCSPDGIVVAFSGYGGPALAVRAGGKGDVTSTHRLWHQAKKNDQRVGSPVIVGEHAYLLNATGTAQCFEIKTGKDIWDRQRVGGQSWSSLVEAGGRFYVGSHGGEVYVLEASPTFRLLATNALGAQEKILSSLAVSDGELFLRTYRHLWCIGKGK